MFPGPTELILILVVAVLVFGPKRIPEIMQSLGHGIRTFKRSMEEDDIPPSNVEPVPNPPAPQLATSTPVEIALKKKAGP